jgi:tetrapyrrole methylase family protein/MazG family protein
MTIATIRVVGLGPGDASLMTLSAHEALGGARTARLRTRRHPAAAAYESIESYDELYENAQNFEELYVAIVGDLVELARSMPDEPVVYAVPGSPVVAERTVELLLAQSDVRVVIDPAVSVIEIACSALGRDPLSGLQIVDALAEGPVRGPGPLLVLQTYSVELLALFADRVPAHTGVTVLHHLGLDDQLVVTTTARELAHFEQADHLTSLWIDSLRSAGTAMDDLMELTATLRECCPWDQEQTHGSLVRHLLEEAYEAIDALENYVVASEESSSSVDASHVVEELGDLLFQIAFHAQLGSEDEAFTFIDVADSVREKLISRHPHVFEGVVVDGADDVATRWESLKQTEKSRDSVTDGIPLQLPALSLYSKLRRKAMSVGMQIDSGETLRQRLVDLITELPLDNVVASDAARESNTAVVWSELLATLGDLARWSGTDLEAVLRSRALELRGHIRARELAASENPSKLDQ